MIRFCPNDGTLLMIAPDHRPEAPFPGRLAFVCEVCPYAAPVVGAAGTTAEREGGGRGGREGEGDKKQKRRNAAAVAAAGESVLGATRRGTATVVARAPVRPRARAQVLGADGADSDAWAASGLQKTEHARCPSCGGNEAFYHEVQTRSADEPATLFLRCVACAHQWRESP